MLETFVPMAFFKKESYKGSMRGMRYMVKKEEDNFMVCVYPEPYCYEATSEEKKTRKTFPFTDEGREEVIIWIREQYEIRKSEWDAVSRR